MKKTLITLSTIAAISAAPVFADQPGKATMNEGELVQMTERLATQSADNASKGDVTVQLITAVILILAIGTVSGGSSNSIVDVAVR